MSPSEAQRRGVRLQAARKLSGLGQGEAAERIGVSRTTLSGWENGEPIDEVWVAPIVRVYGGSKSWVRYGEGNAPAGYSEGSELAGDMLPKIGMRPVATNDGKKKKGRQA